MTSTEISILPVQPLFEIDGLTIAATVIHDEPLIVKFQNVLTEEECDQLMQHAKDRLQRSKLASSMVSEIRTSSSMFFDENENPLIQKVEQRIANLMHLPIEHAEGLQVLHYEVGQQFKPHFDYFHETHKSSENNRISTLVIYLNDVPKGGNTTFPNLGISVTPKKGDAVYFEYFYSDARINEQTLHSGDPVLEGEKWVATQWMRKKRIRSI